MGRYLEPITRKAQLDLLEVENEGASASSGLVLAKVLRFGTKAPRAVLEVCRKAAVRKGCRSASRAS